MFLLPVQFLTNLIYSFWIQFEHVSMDKSILTHRVEYSKDWQDFSDVPEMDRFAVADVDADVPPKSWPTLLRSWCIDQHSSLNKRQYTGTYYTARRCYYTAIIKIK